MPNKSKHLGNWWHVALTGYCGWLQLLTDIGGIAVKLAQWKACFATDLPGITTMLESFLFSVCTGNQVIDEPLTFQGPDQWKVLIVGLQMMM